MKKGLVQHLFGLLFIIILQLNYSSNLKDSVQQTIDDFCFQLSFGQGTHFGCESFAFLKQFPFFQSTSMMK